MVAITTRAANGTDLSWEQVDANFINLATAIDNIGDDVLAEAVVAKDAAVLAAASASSAASSASASATASANSASSSASYVANLALAIGATLIGFMTNGIGAVLRTVFDKLLETISIKDFGAVADGVTNDAAAIVKANTRAGKRPLVFIGVSHVGTPTTITAPIADTMEQIFSLTSQVTIDNGMPIRPEWFGMTAGNIRRAVNATPAAGGVILLENVVYPPSYDTATGAMFNNRGGTPGVDYMVKQHIRIQGVKLPEYAADNSRLVNGSIIQGTFYIASEAQGFQADLFGVDAGSYVISTLYGGVDHDGFCFLQANKGAPVYGANIVIGTVRGLCSGDSSQAHACLFEAIDGGSILYAEGRMANHGVVIKGKNITAGTLSGSLNHGEDVILKSDSYANLASVNISNVISSGKVGGDAGFGFLIQAGTAGGGGVNVANVYCERKAVGYQAQGSVGNTLGDINIGNITTQSCPVGYSLAGGVVRAAAGNVLVNSSSSAVSVDSTTTDRSNAIAQLSANNCAYGADVSGKLRIGGASFSGVSSFSVYHRVSAARVFIGEHVEAPGSTFWAATPALINSWSNVGSNEPFSAGLSSGRVFVSGLIKGGSTAQFALLDSVIRPAYALRFVCLGFTGSAYYTAEVLILPTGEAYVSNYVSGASAYVSLDGVSWPTPF